MEIVAIQEALIDQNIDGWLFYDFHNRDPIAYHILGLDFGKFTSRRWFYFIPAKGEPVKLAHHVEPSKLDPLPGQELLYRSWKELHALLPRIIGKNSDTIAMQYSPDAAIPYISLVDGGTIDLIRSFGYTIVSSADLVQQFESVIDASGYASHKRAGALIHQIKDEAFQKIETSLKQNLAITEYDIQQFIVKRFEESELTCQGEFPIVGVNDHPVNPHFESTKENAYSIRKGDTILIDLWARERAAGSIWADITWCGFAGNNPPEKYMELFSIVRDARNTGVEFIQSRFAKDEPCFGWEVDDAVRQVIRNAGFGDSFVHRTGHSIGMEVHGNGVNIDNLETKEQRKLIPGICFSIEPGIYLKGEMAVRTEVDVFITLEGEVEVTGPEQDELILMNI